MFENVQPFSQAKTGRIGADSFGDSEAVRAALRSMDWNELTARLKAARDVRMVLKREANRSMQASANSFADAAARYFRTKEEGERDVNPVALEQSKGSPGIVPQVQELETGKLRNTVQADTGDARED